MFKWKSRRLRRNLRNFSRKRVDVSKYVKDFYVDNGLAYISCNVTGISDIIDPYSVNGYEWLNESFARFVESNAEYVPTEYPIVLEICGHRFTPKQKAVIEETVSDYYALKLGDAQLTLERNMTKSIFLGVILVLALIAMTALSKIVSTTISETIIVLFWFALWELLDNAVFDRLELLDDKRDAAQMASIKVLFMEKFKDMPVPDEEEVLAEIFEEDWQ
jgi:hypothetical protein